MRLQICFVDKRNLAKLNVLMVLINILNFRWNVIIEIIWYDCDTLLDLECRIKIMII